MGFKEKRKRIENPHHIISTMEADQVMELRAIDSRNVVLEKFSPIVTLDDIKSRLTNNHGPGRYQIIGMDLNNKRHQGYRMVEINPFDRRESLGGGWYRQHLASPDALAIGTDHALAMKDQGRLEDRERRLDDRQQEIEARSQELTEGQQERREQFHEERLDHMSRFFQIQREADRDLKIEMERMRLEAESQRVKVEAEFRERELALKEEMQEQSMIRYQPTNAVSDSRADVQRLELELADRRHSLEIENLKLQMELEMAKLRMNKVPVPKELEKLYWRRKIDEEMPERNMLDQIIEYAEPVIETLKSTPGGMAAVLRILTGGATMAAGPPAMDNGGNLATAHTKSEPSPDWPTFDSEDESTQYEGDEDKIL